jgi:hypothetical protein
MLSCCWLKLVEIAPSSTVYLFQIKKLNDMKNIKYSVTVILFAFLMQNISAKANRIDNKSCLLPVNEIHTKVEFKSENVITPEIIAAKGDYSVIRCERNAFKNINSYDEPVGQQYCYFVCLGNQILSVVNQSYKEMIAQSFAYHKIINS